METLEKLNPKSIYMDEINFEKFVNIPRENISVFDTNILISSVIPKESRNINEFLKCQQHAYGKKRGFLMKKSIIYHKRGMKIVDAIEEGLLIDAGICPVITNNVYAELRNFEKKAGTENIKQWLRKNKENVCNAFMPTEYYRKKYPVISEILKENGDFSVAVASVELGCNIATDDYRSFDNSTLNRIKKEQKKKWPRATFVRHDSESLAMLLGI
ncbi:MAG: hypothetical protein ABIE55_01540 [Candidatus Aenigmatarchaeota archaeon]